MSPEPRHEGDYTDRQVEAAHRVLVDVGQVLASFRDAIVVVGGWVPDLLFPGAELEHVGSIDVDLALDAGKDRIERFSAENGETRCNSGGAERALVGLARSPYAAFWNS